VSAAIRDWVTNVGSTHYIIGSAVGPAPYPALVRDLQRVIGDEARQQALEAEGALPARVIACVGGGSNAIGTFYPFIDDTEVELIGIEAGGEGLDGLHGASLVAGRTGVLHGAMSSILADEDGQILEAHSISAGLDYPGVGPEHAQLRDSGRARYEAVTDVEALRAFRELARLEGILPALEPAHAIAWLLKGGQAGSDPAEVDASAEHWAGFDLLCLSGRGDKDLAEVLAKLNELDD
jgi:tryptophan synthase beta chain